MTESLRIALNIHPYRLTALQRQQIMHACRGRTAQLQLLEPSPDLDRIDPTSAEVLVSEDVPKDYSRWPELRYVQLLSAGIDQLQNQPVWESGILVATAAGTHAVAMAQYVTCTLLMLAHQMQRAAAFRESREWPERLELASTTLRGRTAGILGYGSIGRECARQLHALGMRIVSLKQHPERREHRGFLAFEGTGDPAGRLPERWFGPSQLREMLPLCDVLVVAAPRTRHTLGIIGTPELKLLPSGARVVVISRGGIIDETALAEALRDGLLGGAVVDAFAHEPPASENPLFTAPNVLMTPHVSGVFDDYWSVACDLFCRNLERYCRGKPLLNYVDISTGY